MAPANLLPFDPSAATLVGRLWVEDREPGPRTVAVRGAELFDLSALAPTLSDLFDLDDAASRVRSHAAQRLCSLEEALQTRALLAPCDLQSLKATGVTFADSLIERVLEERARGDAGAAHELRVRLSAALGGELTGIRPGSPEAAAARQVLLRADMWSQYLEVGIGPDAEIFTKAQPMSAIGYGAPIGLPPSSTWSTPEPEIVLAVSSKGRIVGATLGNDFTLRDFEGRSALLLTRAKDNTASCAIGPFVRLFDDRYSLDDVRNAEIHLRIEGRDGYVSEGSHSMARISRDPADLVTSTIGAEHQYPDGLMLFLGTMLIPNLDRGGVGKGFTHRVGDIVSISSSALGTLTNSLVALADAPRWEFGTRALMASLAARGLL